jgi:hypothetical protein
MRIHRVVVALNSAKCVLKNGLSVGSGSLLYQTFYYREMIILSQSAQGSMPFAIGDLDPGEEYVHVFDDVTLQLILVELDTITDFINYLNKKEQFVRSGRLVLSSWRRRIIGTIIYVIPTSNIYMILSFPTSEQNIIIDHGLWESTQRHPAYLQKKEDDKVSYLWDNLILNFTEPMMDGSAITWDKKLKENEGFDVCNYEMAFRVMAKEPRFIRRALSKSFAEAIETAPSDKRYTRSVIPAENYQNSRTAYLLMQLPVPAEQQKMPYSEYREIRLKMLTVVAKILKAKHPHIERMVGIAMEPMKHVHIHGQGSSEDLYYEEYGEWTQEMQEQAERMSVELGMYTEKTSKTSSLSTAEYTHETASKS